MYSHRKNWGEVQPGTFDNVYSTCLQSLNVSTVNGLTEYFLHFEVDTANHGLLKYCGNTPKDCADDCFSGVSINSLKPYQQHQPSSSTVSTTSKTTNSTGHGKVKKMKKNKKVKKISNDWNPIVCSNFLLFSNTFIVKAIVCAYSYLYDMYHFP